MVSTVVDAVQKLDPEAPVYDIESMPERVDRSMTTERSLAALVNLFSVVELALAAVGLYSVLSFTVAAHTHEIGIRKALGARNQDLRGLVLRRAVILAVSGIALGMVATVLAESIFKDWSTGSASPILCPLPFPLFWWLVWCWPQAGYPRGVPPALIR